MKLSWHHQSHQERFKWFTKAGLIQWYRMINIHTVNVETNLEIVVHKFVSLGVWHRQWCEEVYEMERNAFNIFEIVLLMNRTKCIILNQKLSLVRFIK